MAQAKAKAQSARETASKRKLHTVLAVVLTVMALALISAFGWPGWAIRKSTVSTIAPVSSVKPTLKADALPSDASQLVKTMPDHVSDYVRKEVKETDAWNAAHPIETYTITYSNGKHDVNLTIGQWSSSEDADNQYSKLVKQLSGKELASGNVKVSGRVCGKYVVKADTDSDETTALWRNDTVVFEADGPQKSVNSIYQLFPM